MGLRERLTALFGGTPKTDLELVLPRSTVTGHLPPDDPTLPGNRRIAIVLLREAPVLPANPGL